mmetsp:Transcript_4170/g.11967  ORF Transcript_4170/g.11967 Transcript_4170/m.11967 type:complete len:145 (+) Transcript_4170:427-861(+)
MLPWGNDVRAIKRTQLIPKSRRNYILNRILGINQFESNRMNRGRMRRFFRCCMLVGELCIACLNSGMEGSRIVIQDSSPSSMTLHAHRMVSCSNHRIIHPSIHRFVSITKELANQLTNKPTTSHCVHHSNVKSAWLIGLSPHCE